MINGQQPKSLTLPTTVIGVLTIAVLVAVPSTVSFVLTKQNAEDSINIVSRWLADSTMTTVESQLRLKLQNEPTDELNAMKSDLEMGYVGFSMSVWDKFWARRAIHWLSHSKVFTLYYVLAGTHELGDTYGHGFILDIAGAAGYGNFAPSHPP